MLTLFYYIAKLSYEDFSPAMIADSSIPNSRPKEILTLNDLYPFINSLHSNTPLKHSQQTVSEECSKSAHASH
jgi:hypothetical protein